MSKWLVIYRNKTYQFVSYSGSRNITTTRGGKFYNLPVAESQIIQNIEVN
jgi:hypothetical protein